jgi:amino acid transporter
MKPANPAAPGLIRALGPLMATAVVVGTVIGSGVFKKPQLVAANVPGFGWAALAWVLLGLLALLGGLTLAEVAVLYPRAGGNYVFLREAYGRLAGFLWGWVEFWIIRSASIAALATIFSESLFNVLRTPAVGGPLGFSPGSPLLAQANEKYATLAVILGLALVNVRGVTWGGGLQLVITLVKVGSLLAIAALPFLLVAWASVPDPDPRPPDWKQPPQSFQLGGFATALLGALWAYHGWMNVAPVAEEVKAPQRNIPIALIGGVGVVMALYLGANFAYARVLPQEQMANVKDTTVATEFSVRLLGPVGAVIMSAVVMCSVFGALNGNLLVGPRLLYAMGEDGLAPRALGRAHPRYRTPVLATLVLAGWSMLLVVAVAVVSSEGKSAFDTLTDFAMFGAVIFETMAVLSIFVFRRRRPDAERPYRCWGYPVTPALYVLLPALILGNFFVNQRLEALAGVGFIALGVTVYYALGLGRTGPAPVPLRGPSEAPKPEPAGNTVQVG